MNYYSITKNDMLNGDGLRVVLWVAGCSHNCPRDVRITVPAVRIHSHTIQKVERNLIIWQNLKFLMN